MTRTSEELKVVSERLDLATRAARIAIWEWDYETDSLYWSPVFMEIIGIEPEEFTGALPDFMDRLVPEDVDRVQEALRAHLEDGAPYDIEYEMFRKDGTRVAIAAQGQASFREDYVPTRMVGTVRDISDRRSLEAQLLQAEEIANIGHWTLDVARNKLKWSPETWRIHGLEPDSFDLEVDHAVNYYHPDDRERVSEALQGVLTDGHFREVDARLKLDNGDVRYVHIDGIAKLSSDGSPESLFGIIHDRTEIEKQRRELQLTQRLEAVGKLAGGVAHDFNNLLAVILGNLELLRGRGGERLSSVDLELLDGAVGAITRGRDLTQSLLNLARSAALRPEVVDPVGLLEDLRGVLARTLPASLDLRVEAEPNIPPIYVDRGNLEACVINLVVNARDAIEGSGVITLSVDQKTLERPSHGLAELSAGDYVAIRVADTGRGIAEDELAQIFEPFYSTKSSGEGSGLGLPRVKGFAEQSGGAVMVDSMPEQGTCVSILLPVAAEGMQNVEKASEDEALSLAGITVLLVEDIEAVRRVTCNLLELQGCKVISASSGDDALQRFDTLGDIDLVLTDVVMPGDNQGPQLVRRLREKKPGLPAVFMSGYATGEGNEISLPDPSDELLTKPVTVAELQAAVTRALSTP